MKIEYSYCGNIQTDIRSIECKTNEIESALNLLQDNLSQVWRIDLKVGKRIVYIYHERMSGYKRPSLEKIENYLSAMAFACAIYNGRKRIQDYTKLKKGITLLLN